MKKILIVLLAFASVGLFLAGSENVAVAAGKTGVIVVDMQGDFTTWKHGSLAVPGADQAFVMKVNKATKELAAKGLLVFATQDWHPANHASFYTNHPGTKPFQAIKLHECGSAKPAITQVLWPPHCIQGTQNARVLVDNNLFLAVVHKGMNPMCDSYSGFQDACGHKSGLNQILKRNGITNLVIYGLATDYCVKATSIDAARDGYKVTVVTGLSKGVAPGTTKAALKEMKANGIKLVKGLNEVAF